MKSSDFTDKNRIHAYIISGSGRERLAYAVAEKTLGKNYSEDAALFAHPDLHQWSPDGTEIKVWQAREARAAAQVRPNEAATQVFIFHQAERMNLNAQNALLSTIEEPPTSCLFLFVCQNEQSMLPTIRSRCGVLHATAETMRQYGLSPESDDTPADADRSEAAQLGDALMLSLDPAEAAEAVLPLQKLKGEAASALVDAARAACLRAARRAAPGSDEYARALAGAERGGKCLDLLNANVSAPQVGAWIVSQA